jgi:hypothetical protein
MALSDLEIKRTKTKDKPYKLSDGGNMYLWVTPAGGKLWRWAFRYEGKAKLMTFGRYPDVVDLGHDADRLGDGGGNLAVVSDVFGGESAPLRSFGHFSHTFSEAFQSTPPPGATVARSSIFDESLGIVEGDNQSVVQRSSATMTLCDALSASLYFSSSASR